MNKIIEHNYITDSIRINLVYKNNLFFGSLNDQPVTQLKNIKKFIEENRVTLGLEEINFIVGFSFIVEKQRKLENNINENLNNLLSDL